jgi:carboxyl-terminal processing protease
MSRHKLSWLIVAAAAVLLIGSTGCSFVSSLSSSVQPAPASSQFGVLDEAWQILQQDYVDPSKLDATKLSHGAVKGMMDALHDPYSAYMEPSVYQTQLDSLQGKLHGIGASVAVKDGKLTVVAPMPGSPAEKAGIKPDDQILKINDQTVDGLSLAEAVLKIQGAPGTSVNLSVLHSGDKEPVSMTIVRAEITVKSVSLKMVKDNYALIRISTFSDTTGQEMVDVLRSMPPDAAGIVLDLRNNPGGSLSAVVAVASQFLKEGVVVNVVDNQGRRSDQKVRPGGLATQIPMIVLANQNSASGSEVLSGALQDYGRAKLAGTKTYGKGSVNQFRKLSDGSAIYLTIARWLTPYGRPIEGTGLTPDFPSDLQGDDLVNWGIDYLKTGVPGPASAKATLGMWR